MISLTLLKYWREAALAGLLVAVGVQQARLSNEKANHAETKQAHAQVLGGLAEKSLAAYKAVMADDEARKLALSALDKKHLKELQDEQDKLAKLRDDVRTGRVGLRVNAVCTTPARTEVSQATSTTSVDDASSPRLTDSAQRDYFDLRTGIEVARKQVIGLQDYVNNVCLR